MEKINLLALGNSLSREEMRNIRGGVKDEEDDHDKKCCGLSFFCYGIDRERPYRLCNSPGCCSEKHQIY